MLVMTRSSGPVAALACLDLGRLANELQAILCGWLNCCRICGVGVCLGPELCSHQRDPNRARIVGLFCCGSSVRDPGHGGGDRTGLAGGGECWGAGMGRVN